MWKLEIGTEAVQFPEKDFRCSALGGGGKLVIESKHQLLPGSADLHYLVGS
jgi:hypothetical protein